MTPPPPTMTTVVLIKKVKRASIFEKNADSRNKESNVNVIKYLLGVVYTGCEWELNVK